MAGDAEWAFRRYESVRHRLPVADFPARSGRVADLGALADRYDAFVLDAYGVLNVGDRAIEGAVARLQDLRRLGKRLIVLTNGASGTPPVALEKYRRLGFDFTQEEVVASREVAGARLERIAPGATWAAITRAGDDLGDIPARCLDFLRSPDALERADGILFLSSARWTQALQERLTRALRDRPRPLVVANPDIVAPLEHGLSMEPGAFAHDIADALGLDPIFFGKPFPDAFEDALARLADIPRKRIAMVGDTLHTDVLGGAAAGVGTVLVERHGLFAGREVEGFIRRCGIVPDHLAETT